MRRLKFARDPFISKNRDQRTIHDESSGMLTGSFADVFSSVLLRSWVERSFIMYSGRTIAWPKRNAPWENSRGISHPPARLLPIAELLVRSTGRSMKFGIGLE